MSTTMTTTPVRASSTSTSTPRQSYQPSPGRFRHPRLTEIIERRSRTSLTSRNVYNAGVNVFVLLSTFVLRDVLDTIITAAASTMSTSSQSFDTSTVFLVVRGFLLLNIAMSLRPVIPYLSRTDEVNDIPLTPSQRALLGLPPSSPAPNTTPSSAKAGGIGFITPPRYRRSSGIVNTPTSDVSTSDRRSISANYSSSPVSTSRYTVGFSPSPHHQSTPTSSWSHRRASGSVLSPSPGVGGGSPLFYKAVTQNSTTNGGIFTNSTMSDLDVSRSSFNTSTASGLGLNRSQSLRDRRGGGDLDHSAGPGTPSPTGRRMAGGGGGINYKWLYDKGGRLPKSESMGF